MTPNTMPVIRVILISIEPLMIIPAMEIIAIQARVVITEYVKMFLRLVSSKDFM
jgi:hypothetical protein